MLVFPRRRSLFGTLKISSTLHHLFHSNQLPRESVYEAENVSLCGGRNTLHSNLPTRLLQTLSYTLRRLFRLENHLPSPSHPQLKRSTAASKTRHRISSKLTTTNRNTHRKSSAVTSGQISRKKRANIKMGSDSREGSSVGGSGAQNHCILFDWILGGCGCDRSFFSYGYDPA